MTAFAVVAGLLVAGGVAGVGWMLWPSLRGPDPDEREDDAEEEAPDIALRLDVLRERGSAPEDSLEPWTERQPMLPDAPRRVPWDFTPAEKLPVLFTSDGVVLLPIATALLATEAGAPAVLRGRRQGRALHAVRLEDGLYLDLVELVRLLPVIGVELDGRGIDVREIQLFDDVPSIGAADDQLAAIAPWLAGVPGPRVLPEGTGPRDWAFTLAGTSLVVRAWMPAVADGIRADRLSWAGLVRWGDALVECGATPLAVLTELDPEAESLREASLATWRWSRLELAELAAVGHYLEQQEIPILSLIQDAMADGTWPMPDLHDDAQSLTAAAVLNWVGVVNRRSGFPLRALGLLDAALTACAPDDDDNRADIHYNRGACRLQAVLAGGEPTPDALEPALADFAMAARLAPADPSPWVQTALAHHLLEQVGQAEEAWLQAATRARKPDQQRQWLVNARSAKEER